MPSEIAGVDAILSVAIAGLVLFIALTFVGGRMLARRLVGGSRAKRKEAARLMREGSKARATLLSIEPTGTVMNEIYVRCRMRFRLEPLDGSPGFEGEKTNFLSQTHMPQEGEVWPAWYDRTDQSRFAVGQPNPTDPEAQAILGEFDISPSGGGDRVAALERLADLRDRGVLTSREFDKEKQRFLDD
jgi:hypothetical protein